MPDLKRILALASAALILTCGTAGTFPQLSGSEADSAQLRKLIESVMSLPVPAEPFETLRYDSAEQQIYCDGTPVGQHYAGFSVQDGRLTVSAESLGITAAAQDTLTPAEAAPVAGLEYSETDGDVTVRAPFSGSRLIVQSAETPQCSGDASVTDYGDLHILQYGSPAEAYVAYQQLQSDSSIRLVQPDRIYYTDTAFGSVKDENRDPAVSLMGMDSYCKWLCAEKETLPEIKVAVLDTGMDTAHVWFDGRVAEGGIALMTNDSVDVTDVHGHGTHCAGIIAQSTPDNVSILPVKVLSDRGYGYGSEIYCGMLYAIEQRADVVSMSLGGNGEDWLLDEGVAALSAADIPCIVAAGNETEDTKYHHPARNPDCVTVASVTPPSEEDDRPDYTLSDFSNYGEGIDFCAIGYEIQSARAGTTSSVTPLSGTSMATPFVAAAYADLLSYDPSLTGSQLYAYLRENAMDLGNAGFDPVFGWGMISLADFRFTEKRSKPPVIAPAEMRQDAPVTVTLTAPDGGGEIYYTTDGSDPTENGMRYTEPFLLEKTAEVRAAVNLDGIYSSVTSQHYLIEGKDPENALKVADGVVIRYDGMLETLDLAALYPDGSLTKIGDSAFSGSPVKTVILPDSVTEIGERAFEKSALSEIQAAGVTEIGEHAFDSAADLETAAFGEMREIPDWGFCGCEKLRTLTFGERGWIYIIGMHAFENCYALTAFPFPENFVQDIGAYAFANSGLCGALHLKGLVGLGMYAFLNCDITELELPERIKLLSTGVLMQTASLTKLSAPGVRMIENYALAMSGGERLTECDIDFSQVTDLGIGALQNFHFKEPVTFSALSFFGIGALDYVSGASVSLPQLKTAKSGMFSDVDVTLCLPNLETIEKYAFADCTGMLMFGDKVQKIDFGAMSNVAGVAAPEGSLAAEYAQKHDISFYPTPVLRPTVETEQTVRPYQDITLSVEVFSADALSLRWYTVSGDTETRIEGAEGTKFAPPTGQAGTFRYRAVLYENETRRDAVDFTVHIAESCLLQYEAGQKAMLLDWGALRGEASAEGYTVAYQPAQSGEYRITAAHYGDPEHPPVICLPDTGGIIGKANLGSERSSGSVISLEAGVTYLIFADAPPQQADDCSVLYIEPADQTYTRLMSGAVKRLVTDPAILICNPADSMPQIGSMTCFAETMSGSEQRTLVSGTDFLYRLVREDSGNIGVNIYPIGAYDSRWELTGELPVYPMNGIVNTGSVKSGSTTLRKPADSDRSALAFTPETDGTYTFSVDIVQAQMKAELASGIYRSDFWICPKITLADASGSIIGKADANRPVTAELHAGVKYHLALSGVDTDRKYVLHIEQGTAQAWISRSGLSLTVLNSISGIEFDGKAQQPVCILGDAEQDLTAGEDYDLYYLSNDAPGMMAAVAVAKGDYRGFRVSECALRGTVTAGSTWKVPARQTQYYYQFTPEEDGTYTIDADFPVLPDAEESGALRWWLHHGDELITAGVWDSEMFRSYSGYLSAELKAGETYTFYIRKEIAGEMQFRLIRGRSLFGCPMKTDVPAYIDPDGSGTPPQYTITMHNEITLTENTDYVLSLRKEPEAGRAVITAQGIGDYTGRISTTLLSAEAVKPDTVYTVPAGHDMYHPVYYWFTPQETGRYSFRTAPAEAPFREMMQSGIYDSTAETDLDVDISLDNSENVYIGSSRKMNGTGFGGINGVQLKAGVTYYIALYDQGSESQSYSFIMLKEKKPLSDLRADYQPEYRFYGVPALPEIQLYDGETRLREGTDYRIARMDNTAPGTMHLLAEGIGRYIGYRMFHITLAHDPDDLFSDGTAAKIKPDEPFRHTCNYYSFVMENGARVSLQKGSGIIYDLRNPLVYYNISSEQQVWLDFGSYFLVPDDEPKERPETYTLKTEAVSVYFSEVASEDTVYTGSEVKPHARVMLDDKLLTEGTDYRITWEGELKEPGVYRLKIEGIGDYCDSRMFTFRILPAETAELPMLTEGTHAPQIPSGGEPVIYHWIPTESGYCFSRSDNRPGTIQIYDKDGKLVSALSGIGLQAEEAHVTPQAEYRVVCALESPELTGAFIFSLTSDYRMLESCTVRMPERITTALSDGIPAYELYDGDRKLIRGEDYELFAAGGETQPGTAVLCFRGIGRYYGMLEQFYEICPESLAEWQSEIETVSLLPVDTTVSALRQKPGVMQLFRFTAPARGVYQLTLPERERDGVTAFLYDADGKPLEAGLTEIRLQESETVQILCVTSLLGTGYENYDIFQLRVSGNFWESEGITYSMTGDGTAIVTEAAHEAEGGVHIPFVVMNPADGMLVDVTGMDEALCEELAAETHTIYSMHGSRLEAFCADHGLCFAAEDLTDPAAGDITGDGAVDRSDLLTLNRILSERSGMIVSEAVMQAADLNADGILDMTDLLRLNRLF